MTSNVSHLDVLVLTHYTRSCDAVANILAHGFGWMPRRRMLAPLLLPSHDYAAREPQQFGMVSFTELEPSAACNHRAAFGHFGIVVSGEWAAKHGAQRVVYVDEQGPVTAALQKLFSLAYVDVTARIRHPDDGFWRRAYENKTMGNFIGSPLWANMLQLWEFLEPAASASQREWRIVNPVPLSSLSENVSEAVAAISPPKNWARRLNVVPVGRPDVICLVCPSAERERLCSSVPSIYADIEVVATDG